MSVSRRIILKGVGSIAALTAASRSAPFAIAAEGCTGSLTPNNASVAPRIPLEEFVETPRLVEALRRGVREMKKRKPSDPRSWFFQSAIHGVQLDPADLGYKYYRAALDADPKVAQVDRKFWNQCPHYGQHSADFLPWHRAYTFHFEQILREHTGEHDFSLPYWNYGPRKNRKFPEIFGRQHLDGNTDNDADENINPLFMKERDFYLTYYEHGLIPNMPLLELTDAVVDISLPMATQVFFGETEDMGLGGGIADDKPSTRGLLESHPHDHIHRVVGGIIPGGGVGKDKDGKEIEVDALGAMATPPTAGFDPIFSLHHTNIDRLWAEWSCMPGKQWGKLPPTSWFQERPWFFFDAKGGCVNEPRVSYFDYRKLGIRFKYDDPNCTPLMLPEFPAVAVAESKTKADERLAVIETSLSITGLQKTLLVLPDSARRVLATSLSAVQVRNLEQPAQTHLLLRIAITNLNRIPTVGFDVHFAASQSTQMFTRLDRTFVGSVHLFVHAHHGDEVTQDFDITKSAGEIDRTNPATMSVTFVPVALTQAVGTARPNFQSDPLRISRLELLIQSP
jgi:hypothetical protein